MNDIYFMKLALKEAKKAYRKDEVPIGVVIVKNNRVISKAYNKKNSCNSVLKHAELIAIEKASKKLKNWRLLDCTMYVTMIPCPMCASAINQARLSKVFYGTVPEYVDLVTIEKIFNDKNYGNPVVFEGGILSNACGKLLIDFFAKKR